MSNSYIEAYNEGFRKAAEEKLAWGFLAPLAGVALRAAAGSGIKAIAPRIAAGVAQRGIMGSIASKGLNMAAKNPGAAMDIASGGMRMAGNLRQRARPNMQMQQRGSQYAPRMGVDT